MTLHCLLTAYYALPSNRNNSIVISQTTRKTAPGLPAVINKAFFIFAIFFFFSAAGIAQTSVHNVDADAAYTRTINERAQKIVNTLQVSDPSKSIAVRDIIAAQYRNLNEIYNARDEAMQIAKSKNWASEEERNKRLAVIQDETKRKLDKLHSNYINNLSAALSPVQVEQVKDGMTYGVLQITYKGYQDMIPTLTEEQKKQIFTWLTEARELAMDAESSDKKHATFGKYKGRINNYLSAAGYDLKKAGQEWQARIKAEQAAKKAQQ